MIRYYKLFDILNRRGMNKSDLLEITSSKTIAKLSKGENINTDIINKICLFLNCQPGDIMEVIHTETKYDNNDTVYTKTISDTDYYEGEEIIANITQLRNKDKIEVINQEIIKEL